MAIENYRAVLHMLWPMELTGDIMGRILLRYWWVAATNNPKQKVAVTVAYFNKVQRLNAKRASNKGAPLCFEEHEKYMKEALAAHGLSSEVPYEGFLGKDQQQSAIATQSKYRLEKDVPRRPAPKPRAPLVGGLRICWSYNGGRCTSKQTKEGCDGEKGKFAHVCSKLIDEKASIFCLGKHPLNQHPK